MPSRSEAMKGNKNAAKDNGISPAAAKAYVEYLARKNPPKLVMSEAERKLTILQATAKGAAEGAKAGVKVGNALSHLVNSSAVDAAKRNVSYAVTGAKLGAKFGKSMGQLAVKYGHKKDK